jgi:hypothetical protein
VDSHARVGVADRGTGQVLLGGLDHDLQMKKMTMRKSSQQVEEKNQSTSTFRVQRSRITNLIIRLSSSWVYMRSS